MQTLHKYINKYVYLDLLFSDFMEGYTALLQESNISDIDSCILHLYYHTTNDRNEKNYCKKLVDIKHDFMESMALDDHILQNIFKSYIFKLSATPFYKIASKAYAPHLEALLVEKINVSEALRMHGKIIVHSGIEKLVPKILEALNACKEEKYVAATIPNAAQIQNAILINEHTTPFKRLMSNKNIKLALNENFIVCN